MIDIVGVPKWWRLFPTRAFWSWYCVQKLFRGMYFHTQLLKWKFLKTFSLKLWHFFKFHSFLRMFSLGHSKLISSFADFFFFSRKLRVRPKLRVAYILVVKSVAYILVANSKLRTAYNLVVKSKLRVAYILVAKSRLRVVYISVVESELVATYNKVMRLKLRVVYIMEVKLP